MFLSKIHLTVNSGGLDFTNVTQMPILLRGQGAKSKPPVVGNGSTFYMYHSNLSDVTILHTTLDVENVFSISMIQLISDWLCHLTSKVSLQHCGYAAGLNR